MCMAWHSDLHRRKASGGRKTPYRGRRKYEGGSSAAETTLNDTYRTERRCRGGGTKVLLYSANIAQISDIKSGKTNTSKILRVVKNPANVDYNRRGIITKGTLLETEHGLVKVTSRPGQNGVINTVIVEAKPKHS
jgi:small subunit ribosomal protein S8e